MNTNLWQPSPTVKLPYTPLPTELQYSIRAGLIQRNFSRNAIRYDHEFTAKNDLGRLKVHCVAFTNDSHHDPDTAAVAVYYEPENLVANETILDHMVFSGAPFVFIGRKSNILPYGMSANGKPEPKPLGGAFPYERFGDFFEQHQTDINPNRILAVKNGTAKFVAFPQLNPLQLHLITFDVTRDLLSENFGGAVGVLREKVRTGRKLSKTREKVVTQIAVQLLGAIILAHKERLGKEYLRPDVPFASVLKRAVEMFPSYFDWGLIEQHDLATELAYSVLQQATYSSFTPDMLSELYFRAYPDTEKRRREGRFDTPLYLTRRIVDNLPIESIRPEKRLLADITCGWGSFLIAGYERLSRMTDMVESQGPLWEHIIGNDIDLFNAHLAKLALLTTSLTDSWDVENQDALKLDLRGRRPTIIVGNPKFSANRKLGKEATEINLLTGKRKRLQEADKFLETAINLLAPGGYLGMLMPKSFGVAQASPQVRKKLLESCDILELWDLPDEIFEDQAKVRSTVIFAQKREETGQALNYPVRTRSVQGQTLENNGTFTASSHTLSQKEWDATTDKSYRPKTQGAYLITYHTILSKGKWDRILQGCRKLADVAEITPGATVGTKRPWKKFQTPKQVKWLPGVRAFMPRPFCIRHGSDEILYPNELERPRKDKEHLLAAKKVLLVAAPDPSWGKRAKVAIERRGYYVSGSFWVFVPKQGTFSLEVLAAILSWDVSNAWIVESLRYPKIQRRILDTIPVPPLSSTECRLIEKAVREIESAAQREELAPEAQQVLDEVLRKAYGLDEKTFKTLRKVMDWDDYKPETGRPLAPDPETIFRVSGQVETVDAHVQTITLWFDGIPGSHTIPIVDEMPGWFLRADAAFQAEVSYGALRDEKWEELKWWNIRPKEYTYLSEDELLERLSIELAPA